MRFEYVELLATNRLFDSVDGTFFCPFLGSAVQELPDCITKVFQVCSTDDIFVLTKQKQKTSARTGL